MKYGKLNKTKYGNYKIGLLLYFTSTWLTYPIKCFGIITLQFHNFESQRHKQKFTYNLYLQETEKKKTPKKHKKNIHTMITNLILKYNLTTELNLT